MGGFVAGGSSSVLFSSPFNLYGSSSRRPTIGKKGVCVERRKGRRRGFFVACEEEDDEAKVKKSFRTKKRWIVFMGISSLVVPLLSSKPEAAAADQLSPEAGIERTIVPATNPFVSVQNVVGIVGSGLFAVLAPLYVWMRKEKEACDAAVESAEAELKEKEASMAAMESRFRSELQRERESHVEAMSQADQEKQTLLTRLRGLDGTISTLNGDLLEAKRASAASAALAGDLESSLAGARGEIRELQRRLESEMDAVSGLEDRARSLSSAIVDREAALRDAGSRLASMEEAVSEATASHRRAREEASDLRREIRRMEDEHSEREREAAAAKEAALSDLNVELASARSRVEVSRRDLEALSEEFDAFKSSAEARAASDSKLLSEKQRRVKQLEEELDVSVRDASRNRDLVADLTRERDDLVASLRNELQNVENLQQLLEMTRGSLDKSAAVASDLTKQIQSSEALKSELESEIVKIRDESRRTRDSLESQVSESRIEADQLSEELKLAKEALRKSDEDSELASRRLSAVLGDQENLQEEIVRVQEKLQKTAQELESEKELAASLKAELNDLAAEVSKERAAQESLREASESLDELNRTAARLSGELESSNSQIRRLDDEKEALRRALEQERRASRDARERLEEAHAAVMRIGEERSALEARERKLEEELATAGGEILRLRSEMDSPADQIGKRLHVDGGIGNDKSAVPARRVARRRKIASEQEEP
ncbi:hypothetical protein M569_12555 [Genlisea aurea]|uniref:MAR-binding filament-like protein 1-1 n=1 Tax=Genlisea aurea TaxID=192259 RepID=S8DHC2_9LAMI|nr:hypothetical protein M569_12555 [Genlisea aurea]